MIRRMVATAVVLVTAAACGSTGSSQTETSTTRAAAAIARYHPKINPAEFSATVDNPWFPLVPGSTSVSIGTEDGKAARDVFTVTADTLVVNGVPTRVVKDDVYLDGQLEETTLDYYTQVKTVWVDLNN